MIGKRVTSVLLASTMLISTFAAGSSLLNVQAQQVSGNAPFVNTWLVSGPFDTSVADGIYDTVVPENPNLAQKATPTVSSATLASNPASFLIDGSERNQWVTEGKEVPCWAQLEWEEPITVGCMGITLWADGRHRNKNYDLIFTYADGSESDAIRVETTVSDASAPTYYTPATPLENVKSVRVLVDPDLRPYPSITGIAEISVYRYALEEESASVAAIAQAEEDGEYVNLAGNAAVSASSSWQTGALDYPGDSPSADKLPKFAVDGDRNTEWISQMHDNWINDFDPAYWPKWDPKPTFVLEWDNPIEVKEVAFYDRHNAAWPDGTSNVAEVDVTLYDEKGNVLQTQKVTEIDPYSVTPGKATFDNAVKNVSKITLEIIHDGVKESRNVGLGFTEVEVYGREAEVPEVPAGKSITPTLGQNLEYGEERGAWEYFDDRIYNRNYDDYQDLNGYYAIKQNIDTKNKFVYAHTYVYSDKQQTAQVRVGASGSYRVYFNDRALIKPTVPAEVQKDMTVKQVTLKEGWNKLLIQIEHTYTEDVNGNGVPIAKDANVSYLGFYGRITDTSGNEIEGLVYSTECGDESALEITTKGLKDAEGLPRNVLPTGYKEWPYVWNKSTTNNAYGLSASAFRFQAAGGEPGYTWEIIDGALPDNLELLPDGTIADGLVNGKPDLNSDKGIIPATCEEGDYTFTLRVTDKAGNTAEKSFAITVEERPNKWFEEGRVGALSHCIAIPRTFVDPNFSADLWAERAKAQGHSLVSIEALQQNYYWPSKFADPKHDRNIYMAKDENGNVVDQLKIFEEAAKRYGIRFGLYYATEGGGLQHYSTDVFVQNVADLIERYSPDYLYFDGPQAMRGANYDVMYSNVRNYSNHIIINSNAWGEEFGDPDLGTHEASGIYSNVGRNHFVKKVVFEPWKSAHTKNNPTPYYARRDDYAQVAKEMIMNAGRGYVDNNDQMPLMSRGSNWDSPEDIATRYPKSLQEFIDLRENVAAWFAPEGYSERHESTTGTTPYFLSGYGYEDDGKGNYANFAFPNANIGPRWGYATSRDNNLYLHIMEGPDSKIGFRAIENKVLTISPVADKVTSVIWLNRDEEIASFTQEGDTLTIDLSGVEEDKVDTIIKVVTDSQVRKYKLTNLYLKGIPTEDGKVQLDVEGYMTYPALKASLEKVIYSVSSGVVTVDKNGLVSPVSDGTAVVTVSGTYEGTTVSEDITISVKDGAAFVDDEITSVALHVGEREVYGEVSCYGMYDLSLEGRSVDGGATGLNDAEIIWHTGTVDLKGGDKYVPIKITENDTLIVGNGKLIPKPVQELTRAVVWAEVKKDGTTYTSNRVYLDLRPAANLSGEAKITASANEASVDKIKDGQIVNGTTHDDSKWTAEGSGWMTFELPQKADISEIDIYYNTKDQSYVNTPATIEIQTSEDGEAWTTQTTANGPSGSAWFGFYTPYKVDFNTKYIRLQFTGRNGGAFDIMEVMLMGEDISSALSQLALDPTVSEDGKRITIDMTGLDQRGEEVSLEGAQVTVISEDESVVKVNEDNTLAPVNPGRTRITVQVMQAVVAQRPGYAENSFFVTVNEAGKLELLPYLSAVELAVPTRTVSYGKPLVAAPVIKLSDGTTVAAKDAEVQYVIGDERLRQVEGTNTLLLDEDIENGFATTVKAVVTYDGITVESEEITVTALGRNLAVSASNVTVSSVRDRNGVPDGNNVDDRYTANKAVDGNKNTCWAAKQADKSPWIKLDFDAETEIGGVNLVDRGHAVNAIVEGLLEFFDAEGQLIYSQKVTELAWDGQPDNIITLDQPVKAYSMRFTIDPEVKYHQATSERGLAEIQIFAPEITVEKTVVETIGADVTTQAGTVPVLPSEDITVVYNTGEKELVSVTWNTIDKADVAVPGTLAVEGVITGTDIKVSAKVTITENESPEEPSKLLGLLEQVYNKAKDLSTDGVVDSAVAFFEKALAEAKDILDNRPEASDEEITAAIEKLFDAVHGLGLKKGDKTMLEVLITKAEEMQKNQDKYVETHWTQLVDALTKAYGVMEDGDAMDEDIVPMVDELLDAIVAQRYKANKSNLQELINKASGIDTAKYTPESAAVFRAAFKTAQAVLANEALTEDDQAQVDDAAKMLARAMDGLKLAAADGDDGSKNDSDKDDSNKADGSSSSDADKSTAPKTGDSAPIALWGMTALLALFTELAAAWNQRKKRRV